ncbi:phospholipase C type enzyme [Elasticomyces elasticus]|nr:phospholipase C type enzyme [Elasticomyces elasticus]
MCSTPPAYPPPTLRIISLNCWGLKFLAKYRHERLTEIGNQIAHAQPSPDIVGLQECWTQQDYNAIRDRTRHILPHGKFYFSGIFGGGLAILSRWPIQESNMVRYPLNGRPAAFFRGDWYVGKGVACARIRIGPERKDVVEVFCTHLHAPYEREPNDSYLCHRTAQAWEIARLMRHAAERGHLVLGLGDFNMLPLSLAHKLIEAHAPVKDVWRILHPDSSLGSADYELEKARGRPIPTVRTNLEDNGATCDSALNTWRWNEGEKKRLEKGDRIHIDLASSDPNAKRLDYIFLGGKLSEWTVQSANVGLTMRHPTLGCSLSDHFSVEATLVRNPTSLPDIEPTIINGHFREGLATDNDTKPMRLPSSTYATILDLISSYNLRERRQRRLRLTHFGMQLLVSIGCMTAIWWSPYHYVSFVLMLLSSLGLSAGVIDGLMGGLFVGSEVRALKEFEWEIRNAKEEAERVTASEETER